MPGGSTVSKMATKNCPKCDSANPVACKKCACGHVFFTTRRSANALAVDYNEDVSEPTTPQEPEVPRRRTARVTRERPQFYDALQVENQSKRQKELQRLRKASKSDDVDVSSEDIAEKPVPVVSTRKRAESPPATKVAEPPAKKRRGRPPGLTNRRSARAQIMPTNKSADANLKSADFADNNLDDHMDIGNIHDVPAVKALQMNMVLYDINSRISSSSIRAENNLPKEITATDSPMNDPAKIEDAGDVKGPVTAKTSPSKKEEAISSGKVSAGSKLRDSKISPAKKESVYDSPPPKTIVEKTPSPKKKDDNSGTKDDNASGTKDDNASGTKNDNASGTKDDNASGTKDDNASGTKGDNSSGTKDDNASGTKDDNASDTKNDNSSGTKEVITSGTKEAVAPEKANVDVIKKEHDETPSSTKEEKISTTHTADVPDSKKSAVDIPAGTKMDDALPVASAIIKKESTVEEKIANRDEDNTVLNNEVLASGKEETSSTVVSNEDTVEKMAATVKDEIPDKDAKEATCEASVLKTKVDTNDSENIAPKKEGAEKESSDSKSDAEKITAEAEQKVDDGEKVAS